MKHPLVAIVALALGTAICAEAAAQGFMITPVGGFARGPRGWFVATPFGIAGAKRPVCTPMMGGGAYYGQAQMMMPVYTQPGVSQSEGLVETIAAIRSIATLVNELGIGGGLGGGGLGGTGQLQTRVSNLETRVANLEAVVRSGAGNLPPATDTGKRRVKTLKDFLGLSNSEAIQALAESLPQDAVAQAEAGDAATIVLTPRDVDAFAAQMLAQMAVRKVAFDTEKQAVDAEILRIEELLQKLKAHREELKN